MLRLTVGVLIGGIEVDVLRKVVGSVMIVGEKCIVFGREMLVRDAVRTVRPLPDEAVIGHVVLMLPREWVGSLLRSHAVLASFDVLMFSWRICGVAIFGRGEAL